MFDVFWDLGRLRHQFGSFRMSLDQGILLGVQLNVSRDLRRRLVTQLALDRSQ
jgi:hypothetical protein